MIFGWSMFLAVAGGLIFFAFLLIKVSNQARSLEHMIPYSALLL